MTCLLFLTCASLCLQHQPSDKLLPDSSVDGSIRITVGNEHYTQQAAALERYTQQAAALAGRPSAEGKGGGAESKSSLNDRLQRMSGDQEPEYPNFKPQSSWSLIGGPRSPERYPSRDYDNPQGRRSFTPERQSSGYYRRSVDESPGRRGRSPGRSPDRRGYGSPGRSPDRRGYRSSPGRSPDRRNYRQSPGRSSSRSPGRDRYSRSPSSSRSSQSEQHSDNKIFRDAAEYRNIDVSPDAPSVRSILKNKADLTPTESPFRSESSLHGDMAFGKPHQSHFGLADIGCLDEIEDEDEFLYGGGGASSIKPATTDPAVGHEIPGKPKCQTFDYGHKPKRPDGKSFPSSLVPDYDEDGGVDDTHSRRGDHGSARPGPSNVRPASPKPKPEPKKEEPHDPTIENILKAIGFNFELSKLMQEKAKKEREKQEKKDTISYSINQTSSFLGSGLKNIDLGSVFNEKEAAMEDPPARVEKTELANAELSYAELGRKYREEQARAYQQGRSPPPPFREKPRVERSRRKSESLSPPRRERSRRRSESFSPPPQSRRQHRSPSFERDSPPSSKRSRRANEPEPARESPHRENSSPRTPEPTSHPPPGPAPVDYRVPPPYYGGPPGWDPNMPYGNYGAGYAHQQQGYYPPHPEHYASDWPPQYHPGYPPPPMPHDNNFFTAPPISSNLKVISVVDDTPEEKKTVVISSQKASSRTVLPPKPESERRIELRSAMKPGPHRLEDPKITEGRWQDDPPKSTPGRFHTDPIMFLNLKILFKVPLNFLNRWECSCSCKHNFYVTISFDQVLAISTAAYFIIIYFVLVNVLLLID